MCGDRLFTYNVGKVRIVFAGNKNVTVIEHNFDTRCRFGKFCAVFSSFGIHHVEDDHKRSLTPNFELLNPSIFCNFEHVSSATEALNQKFLAVSVWSITRRAV